jgi:vancomycin resistance protein YoaR
LTTQTFGDKDRLISLSPKEVHDMKRIIALIAVLLFVLVSNIACNQDSGNSITKINVEKNTKPDDISIEGNIKKNIFLEDENVGGFKVSQIMNKLYAYSRKFDVIPQEAVLDKDTWEIVQKEKVGKKVNMQRTLDLLMSADSGDRKRVVVERVMPKTKARLLRHNIRLIGKYSTRIQDHRDSRLNNIKLAAERLDYEKLQPGEEFSFNSVLGRRTIKKGYAKAPIIINTEEGPKKAYGVGGGICQLSSTLFNAVYRSKMHITERHSHSKVVGYVPKGWDAMVAYGTSDFKFVNNRNYPIMIRVYISHKYITVRIYENRNL